jgi:hypothetical protein
VRDKNYFLIFSNPPWAGPNATRTAGPDIKLDKGTRVGKLDDHFKFNLDVDPLAENPLDFPPCDWHDAPPGLLLFSKKFVDVLNRCNITNIEYFPAEVIYTPTGDVYEYYIANIIGLKNGLDLAKSKYDVDEDGFIFDVDKIVFDDTKISGEKIFRLKEKRILVVVHKSVKGEIEAADLSGIQIVSDDAWKPCMI